MKARAQARMRRVRPLRGWKPYSCLPEGRRHDDPQGTPARDPARPTSRNDRRPPRQRTACTPLACPRRTTTGTAGQGDTPPRAQGTGGEYRRGDGGGRRGLGARRRGTTEPITGKPGLAIRDGTAFSLRRAWATRPHAMTSARSSSTAAKPGSSSSGRREIAVTYLGMARSKTARFSDPVNRDG